MKTLYQASNIIEAHMILHMLQQEGLKARVDGEYLQGAVGELPAAGLVRVMIEEEDYAKARFIVDQWDAAQPVQEAAAPAPKKQSSRLGGFVAGVAVGLLCAYLYYQSPVSVEGADFDRDGILDEKRTIAASGHHLKSEADRNFDGKVDYIVIYDRDNTIEFAEFDDNFDGVFESRAGYRLGNPYLIEVDTDGDGYREYKTNYVDGVLTSAEYLEPVTGLPQKVDYFHLGKLSYSEKDIDRDGRMDQRIEYNRLGEVISIQAAQ